MSDVIFPSVAQPPMRREHVGPGSAAIIDNRSGLPDDQVRAAIEDHWVEAAGLQFSRPSTFQLYSNYQTSMLARTPFKTPGNVIDEIKLARSVADTDDDVAASIGGMLAIAYGEGVQNHHRDETTLAFFNQIGNIGQAASASAAPMDLESVLEEMHREYLIAGSLTTLSLYVRQRMSYYPLKSDEAVNAQLQVPRVGILPAENLRVVTNDLLNEGVLAYCVEEYGMKRWLDEFFNPTTSGTRKAIMAMQEPIVAALFTGRMEISMMDPDPAIRGLTLYTLNQKMIHRTSMPKGAQPYARPLLTRNFALLEAKRLLNIMDYALLQGGTNYIVVAKKGTDNLPAQQPEIDNLANQVTHASRSGVMVGDHRLSIEIITPDLEELLNPAKRKLLGRKISMGLLRQSEQVTGDSGTQGALNEMELLARVISADRTKILRHAQTTFYNDTARRNRTVFKAGAPTIWAPKVILAGAKDFWSQVLNARDRGDIPRRWAVEALGFNYDAGLAEREREITRGDDDILAPAAVPFSNPGEPQDNGPGRPKGTSSNNGRGRDTPGQGRDPAAPRRTIQRNAGETIRAIVDGTEVSYVGETTLALMEGADGEPDFEGYVMAAEREVAESGQPQRYGQSIIVPVNHEHACTDYRTAKLGDGLRIVLGVRVGDEAIIAKAVRFTEPHYDLKQANDYVIRWGFTDEPLVEDAKRRKKKAAIGRASGYCVSCGNPISPTSTGNCPNCGKDPDGDGDVDPAGGGEPPGTI